MDKLKMHSVNKVDENVAKIGKLFPNCVTERKNVKGEVEYAIDFDMLKQELSDVVVEGNEERYQFTWPDKKKSILLANAPISKTLRPCREESVDFDNTENLYIEGDNLDVLKLLQETYLGKIKMIYIDPPYNTGNDFVYNDDFAESTDEYLANSGQFDEEGNRLVQNTESNGRYHTDWLNMIYPRLKLAKDLLSEDGVIFISIDDNEVENLKKISDEIFGGHNFVGQWNWFKSATPPNLSYKIKKNIEYILVYEKNRDNVKYHGVFKTSSSNDPFTKPQNTIKDLTFPPATINTKLPDGVYKAGIYGTEKFPNELKNDMIVKNGLNANQVTFSNRFIWIQETLNENIKKGLRIDLSKQLVLSYKKMDYEPECPPNLINKDVNVDTTEQAGAELRELFNGAKVFDYPKHPSLLTYIMKFKNDTNAFVLDFFSGSATTAHAVMQLNAEDGGNRKFIMVQLPEETDEKSEAYKAGYKNICEIGKERIRRAGTKIKEMQKKSVVGEMALDFMQTKMGQESSAVIEKELKIYENLDTGFRVLKLDSTNMKDVYYNPAEYEMSLFESLADNIKEDRTPEDLLFQVMLDLGVVLSSKIEETTISGKKVFNVADGFLYACFDSNITEDVITEIAKKEPYYFVMRDSSMANDSVATNFDQIFATYSPSTVRKVL